MSFSTEPYLVVIINACGDINGNRAVALLPARSPALRTGFGDYFTLAVTFAADGGADEATEYALLDSAYLPRAVTV